FVDIRADGIDNWSVTIHRDPGLCGGPTPTPTPPPGSCPGVFYATAILDQANLGSPYSAQFNAVGSTGPYTFAVVGGALPPGISLSNTGAVSGTPTAAGSYTFSVQPTASSGCTGAVNSFTIDVNVCPVLSFSPLALPDAVAGAPYRQA